MRILISLVFSSSILFANVNYESIMDIIVTQRQMYQKEYCLCHNKVLPEEFDENKIGRNSEVGNVFLNEVIFTASQDTKDCIEIVEKVAEKSDIGTFDSKMQNALLGERIAEDPQGVICTSLEIAEKRKEFEKKVKGGKNFFKQIIDEKVCNNEINPIENIRPSERKCRRELLNLVVEYEDITEGYCQLPTDLSLRGKTENDCIEKESYRYILSESQDDFMTIKCRAEVDKAFTALGKELSGQEYSRKIFDCEREIKSVVTKALYEKDYERCENTRNFNMETKSPIVCANIILSPQLSFLSDAEEQALADCLEGVSPSAKEEVKKCVYTMFDKNEDLCFDKLVDNEETLKKLLPKDSPQLKPGMCISEKDLLEQMKNRYCPARLFETSAEMDTCIQMILDQGLRIFRVSPEELKMCEAMAQKEPTDVLKEIAKKKCLRTVMYSKMLENNLLEVARCWNKAEYPTLKDRRKCNEEAQSFYRMLDGCESMTAPESVKACLGSLSPPEFLRNYLETKAVKFGVDVTSCNVGAPDYLECMLKRLYPSAEDYNLLKANLLSSCNKDGTGVMSECQDAFAQIDQAPMDGQELSAKYFEDMDKKVSEIVNNSPPPQSDVDDVSTGANGLGDAGDTGTNGQPKGYTVDTSDVLSGGSNNATGSVVVAGAGAGSLLMNNKSTGKDANNQLNNFSDIASKDLDDSEGLFASFKNIKFRKHPDHLCQQIGKGAMLRVAGTVGGVVTTAIVHARVMKKHKEDGGQGKAFDHLKQAWKGAIAGVGVKLAFNTMAKMIYKDTEAKAATVISTTGEIPRCRFADIPDTKTSYHSLEIQETYVVSDRAKVEFLEVFNMDDVKFLNAFDVDEMSLILADIDNSFEKEMVIEQDFDPETLKEIRVNVANIMNNMVLGNAYAEDKGAANLQSIMSFAPIFFSMMNQSKEDKEYEKEKPYVEVLPESKQKGDETGSDIEKNQGQQEYMVRNVGAISKLMKENNFESEPETSEPEKNEDAN